MREQELPRDVLVLGASGTIGGAVANELTRLGAKVHTPGRDMQWEPAAPWGLVCCFGDYGTKGYFEDLDPNDIIKTLQLNLYAQIYQVHKFLSQRPQCTYGRIVLMSGGGIGGHQHPEQRVAYVTAKAGIAQFVKSLAAELLDFVTINAVAPGPVKSRMTEGEEREWVSPDLAAKMIGWLVMSDKAADITGRLLSARFDRGVMQ